jgi:hypothetical protein
MLWVGVCQVNSFRNFQRWDRYRRFACFLRLFAPLQGMLSVASQTPIFSRQRHNERSWVGSWAAAVQCPVVRPSPPADPRSRRSTAAAAIRPQRQFACQEKSVSLFIRILRANLYPPTLSRPAVRISDRPPLSHTLLNRRCAEPVIASSARARGSHRASLKAPPLQRRMASFSPRAAPLFFRHDCDIMKCPVGPQMRECRGWVRSVRAPDRQRPRYSCRLARESRASIVSWLLVRHHKKSDGLRRERVIGDRAGRPAS